MMSKMDVGRCLAFPGIVGSHFWGREEWSELLLVWRKENLYVYFHYIMSVPDSKNYVIWGEMKFDVYCICNKLHESTSKAPKK